MHLINEKNVTQSPAERDSLSWRFNMIAADCDVVAVHCGIIAVLKNHIFSV